MFRTYRFKHPQNDHAEVLGPLAYVWAAIFGPFYLAYRGFWGGFFLVLFILQPLWLGLCLVGLAVANAPGSNPKVALIPTLAIIAVYFVGVALLIISQARLGYLRRGWKLEN
jgi:hypothetical protein